MRQKKKKKFLTKKKRDATIVFVLPHSNPKAKKKPLSSASAEGKTTVTGVGYLNPLRVEQLRSIKRTEEEEEKKKRKKGKESKAGRAKRGNQYRLLHGERKLPSSIWWVPFAACQLFYPAFLHSNDGWWLAGAMRCAAFPLYFTRFPKLRKSPADHLVWVSSRVAKGGANRRQVIRLDVYIYIQSSFFFVLLRASSSSSSSLSSLNNPTSDDCSLFFPPFSLMSLRLLPSLHSMVYKYRFCQLAWSLMLSCRVQPSGWIGHCCSAQITSVAIRWPYRWGNHKTIGQARYDIGLSIAFRLWSPSQTTTTTTTEQVSNNKVKEEGGQTIGHTYVLFFWLSELAFFFTVYACVFFHFIYFFPFG